MTLHNFTVARKQFIAFLLISLFFPFCLLRFLFVHMKTYGCLYIYRLNWLPLQSLIDIRKGETGNKCPRTDLVKKHKKHDPSNTQN